MPNDVNNIHVVTVISRVSHSFGRLKTFKNLTEQDICEPNECLLVIPVLM